MPETKISDFERAGPLTGQELLTGLQNGDNANVIVSDLADYILDKMPNSIVADDFNDLRHRLLASVHPDGPEATRNRGFNEFDIIPADDGTGDYEMVFDNRSDIRYLRFHDPSEIQGIIDRGEDVSVFAGHHFPSILKYQGRYYVYAVNDNDVRVKYGDTIEALIACDPLDVYQGFDPSVRVNPNGGFVSGGHNLPKAAVWTAPTPLGPWTFQGRIFMGLDGRENDPGYATNQADGVVFFEGGKTWHLCSMFYNGYQDATPDASHSVITELDENWKAKGKPMQFTNTGYNPVYIKNQGREEMWWALSTGSFDNPGPGGIYRMVIASTGVERPIDTASIASVQGGYDNDVNANITPYVYGDITNTVDGITASDANSGMANFLSLGRFYEYSGHLDFTPTELPASGQTAMVCKVFKDPAAGTSILEFTLAEDGAVCMALFRLDGTTFNYFLPEAITAGQRTQLVFTFEYDKYTGLSRLTLNDVVGEWINYGEIVAYTYSLFNTHTFGEAYSNQFLGTIHSFELIDTRQERFYHGSLTVDDIVKSGITATKQVALNDSSGSVTGGGMTYSPIFGTSITGAVTNDQAELRIQDGRGNEAFRLLGSGITVMSGTFFGNAFSADGTGAAYQFRYGASIDLLRLKSHGLGAIVADATTPVPYTGEGTAVYDSGKVFLWNGTRWKQLAFTTNT